MMMTLAVLEDTIAVFTAGVAIGAELSLLMHVMPIVVVLAVIFTFIFELIEEYFEPGEQPLERLFNHHKNKKKG
jgi:hypothetical protein